MASVRDIPKEKVEELDRIVRSIDEEYNLGAALVLVDDKENMSFIRMNHLHAYHWVIAALEILFEQEPALAMRAARRFLKNIKTVPVKLEEN